MPLAKRPKLSVSEEELEKSDNAQKRLSLQNEVDDEHVVNTGLEEVSDRENEFVDSTKKSDEVEIAECVSPINHDDADEGILSPAPEKDSGKRARSKSVGEASIDCKLKEEPIKPVRISERLSIKRNRLGETEDGDARSPLSKRQRSASVGVSVKKPTKKVSTATTQASKGGKKRKPWAQWSVQDKKLFFIYLGEFGKNFEAISKKISSVAKMKGFPEKDKTQVRYFYYRCWSKVSKFIKLDQSGDVKTVTQELYGLINYGVMRSHVKEVDPQFSKCINELIHFGETTYLTRSGKSKRFGKIKTPLCNYLKKLNKVEEKRISESSVSKKLPSQVTIELTPKTTTAWTRVQELSHNPRVRFKLSINRTLEAVFRYLNSKWKSNRLRLKEALDEKPEVTNKELVFSLHPSCKVVPFVMKPTKTKKMDVAFKNYVENVLPTILKSKRSKSSKESDGSEASLSKQKLEEDCKTSESNGMKLTDEEETFVETPNITKEASTESVCAGVDSVSTCSSNQSFVTVTVSSENPLCSIKLEEETREGPESESVQAIWTTTTSLSSSLSPPSKVITESCSVSSSSIEPVSSTMPSSPTNAPSSPTTTSSSSTPTTSTVASCALSSPLRSLTAALNLKPVSSLASTPPSSSVHLSHTDNLSNQSVGTSITQLSLPPLLLLTPSPSRKKASSKPWNRKKTNSSITCDNDALTVDSLSSEDVALTSPNKTEPSGGIKAEEVQEEMKRLQTLADLGFTQSNSNTVTLLHLSVLLGRASTVQLEYEWVERQHPKSHLTPAFCHTSNQVANVLRRLCNIAALELASFQLNKQTNSSKASSKSDAAESSSKKDGAGTTSTSNGRSKKREGVRSVGTMTDMRRTASIPSSAIPLAPTKMIQHRLPPPELNPRPSIQLNGRDSVFRVPLVPALRPVLSKEEEHKLEMQQQQATKALMQLPYGPRSRLLKRRSVPSRKKQPPIIVQRALLPKVSSGQVLTYIQPEGSGAPVLVSMSPHESTVTQSPHTPSSPPVFVQAAGGSSLGLVISGPAMATTTSTSIMGEASLQHPALTVAPSGPSILELAVKSAQIGSSPIKQEPPSADTDMALDSIVDIGISSTQTSVPSSASPPPFILPKESNSLSIADHGDISISDFDLSLASTSNMGPDAGDKFLDSVLERSHQGFAGLITPVAATSSSTGAPDADMQVDTSLSSFDLPDLKSPCQPSLPITSSSHNFSEHSWMAGEAADVSLSSILGEFSSFQQQQGAQPQLRTPCKTSISNNPILFDQSSSDAVDNTVSVTIPKQPSFVSDVSLTSLLGDPALSSPMPRPSKDSHQQPHLLPGEASSRAPTPLVPHPSALFSEASQDSLAKLDVEVTLQGMGMVNESSLDLVSKFETLAAHMNNDSKHQDQEASRLNTPVKQSQEDQPS